MRTLLRKLNWRLMLVHFFAFCIFIYAFREFMFLHDLKYIFDFANAYVHKKNLSGFSYTRFSNDQKWIGAGGLIGLLVGFAISLTVCIRSKWFWLNPLLIFLLTFFLHRFIIQFELGYYISHLFFHLPAWIRLGGTGCIILFTGCYLFFSIHINGFIKNGKFVPKPQKSATME